MTFPRPKPRPSDRAPQFVPDVFMVSYWAIGTTNDIRLSNVVKSSKVVSTKLFGETYEINVPSYTNEKVIEVGDELLIAKELPTTQPATKRARIEELVNTSKSQKGSKAKGKGKSKKAK